MVEQVKYHIGVWITEEDLINKFQTPIELIDAIEKISHKLKLIKKQKGHYQNYMKEELYTELNARCKF